MNIFIKTIILVSLLSESFGQKNKNENYTLYHDNILAIEQFNSRSSFDSSLTAYSDNFSKYDRIMARDAYNACQIAALKKHNSFSEFFFICAKSGISKDRLLSNQLIQDQYSIDPANLTQLYLKGAKEYLNRIDTTLRREMVQRAENEQKNKGKDNYSKICTENFNRILELSKQGKFPGESLIGNSDEIESLIFPTLCHYPYSYLAMEPYLIDAMKNGNLTPISLIYLYGFNQTRKSILYTSNIPNDTLNFKVAYNSGCPKRGHQRSPERSRKLGKSRFN